MSRRTVSQYTNYLLPEDVKTDSVTIHKLLPEDVKTGSVTIFKMFPEDVKTYSVTFHILSSGQFYVITC
jgi:hypothetical protein